MFPGVPASETGKISMRQGNKIKGKAGIRLQAKAG